MCVVRDAESVRRATHDAACTARDAELVRRWMRDAITLRLSQRQVRHREARQPPEFGPKGRKKGKEKVDAILSTFDFAGNSPEIISVECWLSFENLNKRVHISPRAEDQI